MLEYAIHFLKEIVANGLTPHTSVVVAAAVALLLRVVVVLAEEGVVGHDVQAISRVQLHEEFKSG